MKIIRSEGQSFTATNQDRRPPTMRGLVLVRPKGHLLTSASYPNKTEVQPEQLHTFLEADYSLALRQVVSALDKVISKPKKLKWCHLDTYVDRTLLAQELWKLLEVRYGAEIQQQPNGEAVVKEFKKAWLWKVHPYAENAFDPRNPSKDKNAEIIEKFGDKEATRAKHQGRWHSAFWTAANGKPEYSAIAKRIWDHLFDRERKIDGDERKRSEHSPIEAAGLVSVRGQVIAHSANDPLTSEKRAENAEFRAIVDDKKIVDAYFHDDVAAHILSATVDAIKAADHLRRPDVNASTFGQLLYDHFGTVLRDGGHGEDDRKKLWALHNRVRKFYQITAKSTRFNLAISGETRDLRKVEQILPRDRETLLSILTGKSHNSDISALVRAGKLLAHASDIPETEADPQSAFESRSSGFLPAADRARLRGMRPSRVSGGHPLVFRCARSRCWLRSER